MYINWQTSGTQWAKSVPELPKQCWKSSLHTKKCLLQLTDSKLPTTVYQKPFISIKDSASTEDFNICECHSSYYNECIQEM